MHCPGQTKKRFQITNSTSPLTISSSKTRTSHRVIAQMLKILLEEGLGYERVQLVETDHLSPVLLQDIQDVDRITCSAER